MYTTAFLHGLMSFFTIAKVIKNYTPILGLVFHFIPIRKANLLVEFQPVRDNLLITLTVTYMSNNKIQS